MNSNGQNINLYALILANLDGSATEKMQQQLADILESDAQARGIYIDFVNLYSRFRTSGVSELMDVERSSLNITEQMFEELLKEERNAPSLGKKGKQCPSSENCIIEAESKNVKRFPKYKIYLFAACVAALIAIITIPQIFQANFNPTSVGKISDALDVRSNSGKEIASGQNIFISRESTVLDEGCLEMLFDNGAIITIEAPAKYKIVSEDRIDLDYGMLYATVPQKAIGFAVKSGNTNVVDLGTEFGIHSMLNGDTELHVFDGKTTVAALNGFDRVSMDVTGGTAINVSDSDGKVSLTDLKPFSFIRHITEENGIMWRGQQFIDLADITGGGTGFGTGKIGSGYLPNTGSYETSYEGVSGLRKGESGYNKVPDNPFIDGVFVPSGKSAVISSEGHKFRWDSETNSIFFTIAANGPSISERPKYRGQYKVKPYGPHLACYPLNLGDVQYGTEEHPAVYMHTNSGITFDLEQMREYVDFAPLDKFEARIGIPENTLERAKVKLSWYLLFDGEVRYSRENTTVADGAVDVSLPVEDTRFITFMITDAEGDQAFDWCLMGDPRITLETAQ
ncbi:NPCBM/NEW2 domain-containing protein [Sedimentisphaera salicampi]|uniref:NPCBM/NEW2 domain-containing protein n=1 Tax=Sedimentisphaera salicampi TaxID=1941349 RepID=UPI000B9AE009|nr:NPCBM/NEW2 domain-containing protein [Sedimentisphaera salicampi]OXU15392.1 FecR protein [Sedimentisphaera salicampi]